MGTLSLLYQRSNPCLFGRSLCANLQKKIGCFIVVASLSTGLIEIDKKAFPGFDCVASGVERACFYEIEGIRNFDI